MNTEAPGNPWDQEAASPPADKPARQPRQRRAPREAAAEPRTAAQKQAAAKSEFAKSRKKKEKVERAAPETIRVTMREYAAMRVGEDHAKCFVKLYDMLSDGHSKTVRSKLLTELQKVLG